MVARMLPAILFGPFAGAIVDRVDRKKLMITADIARGALYALMPFLGPLWAIFVVSFVIECLSLLWTPARDASLPNLVPRRQLANANSLGLITTYATLPLGGAACSRSCRRRPACSPTSGHPAFLALWLDAFTFVFSALARQPDPDPAAGADVVPEARPLARRQGHRGRLPVPARELARARR